MISAQWLRRKLVLRGVLTTVSMSTTDRDDMNRPVEVTTTKSIRFLMHPEQGAEVNDSQQVGTRRMVGYFDSCDQIATTSRLTYGGIEFEFVEPPRPWISPHNCEVVGQTATFVRTA